MGSLNVRNLPESVQKRLRLQAARSGRSMEAEAREILAAATAGKRRSVGPEELQAFVDRLYGAKRPTRVVEELIDERRRAAERE